LKEVQYIKYSDFGSYKKNKAKCTDLLIDMFKKEDVWQSESNVFTNPVTQPENVCR